MKRQTLSLGGVLLVALGLAGCSTPTSVVLTDGREIQALDTPDYDDETGFYELELPDGRHIKLNEDQIESINAH